MSDTLEKLQAMLAGQLGMPITDIDPDSPLKELGMDAEALDELRFLIEENYNINMYVMAEENYDVEIDMPEKSVKDQTLRQIAVWVDGWVNSGEIHPRFHGRHTRPL